LTYGPASYESSLATDLFIEARVLNGHGASPDTQALAKQALAQRKSWWIADSTSSVPSIRNVGAVLLSDGDFAGAVPYYEQVVSVVQRRSDLGSTAQGLSDLGYVLTLAERYGPAEDALDRALLILDRNPSLNVLLLASTLERKGSLLLERGAYGAARPILEKALGLATTNAPIHPITARLLDSFGNLCWFQDNRLDAERYYRSALELAEHSLNPGHPAIATYLRDLATSRQSAGYLAEAQSLQERAVAIDRRTLGERHIEYAYQLNDLADTRAAKGDFEEARRLYEQSLDIIVKRFGRDQLDVATLSNNVALLLARLGEFEQARDYMNQAVAIWQHKLGPEHPYVGLAFGSLAEVFGNQGQFDAARIFYERALAVRQHALKPTHSDIAQTLTSLAETVGHLGDVRKAKGYSLQALAIWRQNGSSNNPWYARAIAVDAELALLAGDRRAAQEFEDAISRLQTIMGPTHPEVAAARAGLAAALLRRGDYGDAMTQALGAEDAERDYVRVTTRYLAERQALFFAAHRPLALDIALDALRRDPSSSNTLRVLNAVIRSRSLVLDELATRQRTISERRTPALDAATKALVEARQRLANLVVQGPDINHATMYLPLVIQARQDKEQAERRLAEQSAQFRGELALARAGLEDVRPVLPPRSALVSFVRYAVGITGDPAEWHRNQSWSLAAFIVCAGKSRVSFVPLGAAAALERTIARWRTAIAGVSNSVAPTPRDEIAVRRLGAELRQRVWDPVSARLPGITNVLIVPDGPLNLVSFASLPTSNGEFIVERGPSIHYLSAERDLIASGNRRLEPGSLLAVGDPAFEDEPLPTRRSMDPCHGFGSLAFGPLPATRQEVDEIAGIWSRTAAGTTTVTRPKNPALRARVLWGADATEAAVKRLAPGQRVLHFATHGFFLGSECTAPKQRTRGVGGLSGFAVVADSLAIPLLRSGLALAGANRRRTQSGAREDGILTAEEVASLDLDGVEWAVLSACDTGVGELRAGEGVIGLRRAFHIAGVHTVIMSLWAVEDESARQWMNELYTARVLRGLTTIEAVRSASVTVLRDRRRRGLSTHPFYWAAFVAAGDWH
jgi:CHAT domain-containing protein/tetratricopeptide (TPR) repeat protein